jgi:AcrR family transcriptional regulator
LSKIESNKECILREAAVLFSRKGYERTSMREIAEQVGVSKPAIYYHFSNKQALFEELITTSFNLSQKRFGDIANCDCDPLTKLKDLALGLLQSTKLNPDGARFMHDLMAGNIRKNIKLDHRNVFKKQEELFNQILNSGKDQGAIRKDLDNFTFIMVFIGTLNMYTIGYLKGQITDLNEKTTEHIINVLLNGIKN